MRTDAKSKAVLLLLSAFFMVSFVGPILTMLQYFSRARLLAVFTSRSFLAALGNSLTIAANVTVLAVVFAFVFAVCIQRTSMRAKRWFRLIFTLPMLIPSISHGMGLVLLLGKNGLLTNLFGLSGSVYGYRGVVLGSLLYAFPVAFLMLSNILAYEDASVYEAATSLGIRKPLQLRDITLPYLARPLISVVFSVFTLVITDYGVPLMVGGKCVTLPVLMYQEVIGLLDFGKGVAIGLVLLLPAVTAFLFDIFTQRQGLGQMTTRPVVPRPSRARDAFATAACSILACAILLPLINFVLLTFVQSYPNNLTPTLQNIAKALRLGAGKFLGNSLCIAACTAFVGTALAYLTACFTARTRGKLVRVLHLVSITSLAVPGLVLGLCFALFFKGSALYGTVWVLVLVNTIHFFASAYLIAYNALEKLNENLENVGLTLGVGRIFIIRDVLVPQSWATICEMFGYFFVNSMITISAVSFLSSVDNKPLTLLITQFEAQSLLECSAFVSLLILAANLLVKALVHVVSKQSARL